jgi:hypothetical protein
LNLQAREQPIYNPENKIKMLDGMRRQLPRQSLSINFLLDDNSICTDFYLIKQLMKP